MSKKRINIYVPGILTFPGESDNWDGKAVTWTMTTTCGEVSAEKVEYLCGPIDRVFGQKERVLKLYRTLDRYRESWEIRVVGHSNGASVAVECLKAYPCPPIAELHLVCSAGESDFRKNGLNTFLLCRRVGRVLVYVAGQDLALRLAHTWAGKLLHYGTLGLHGPERVLPNVEERVGMVQWPEYGHSSCWAPPNFDRTMRHFVRPLP